MKFFLTIYICSVVSQQCAQVPMEKHVFQADQIESLELYPKYTCDKLEIEKKPEA